MRKSVLDQILDLSAAELPDDRVGPLAAIPTIEDRANLYLNAVYGPREYSADEYASARNILIEAMAANVRAALNADSFDDILPTESNKSRPTRGRESQIFAQSRFAASALEPFFDIPDPNAPRSTEYREARRDHPYSQANVERAALASIASALSVSPDKAPLTPLTVDTSSEKIHLKQPPQVQPNRKIGTRTLVALTTLGVCLASVAITAAILPLVLTSLQSEPSRPSLVSQYNPSEKTSQQRLAREISETHSNNPDLAARLLGLGNKLIADGDIYGGRLVLTEAAGEGNAAAALALGTTFDPNEMRRSSTASDVTQARRWYAVARKLGSQEAQARLDRLTPSNHPK